MKRFEFSMRPGEFALVRNDKYEWNNSNVIESYDVKIDFLGRRFEKQIHVDPLGGNVFITNRKVKVDFTR